MDDVNSHTNDKGAEHPGRKGSDAVELTRLPIGENGNEQQLKNIAPSLGELWCFYSEFKVRTLSVTTIKKDFRRVANHIQKLPTQRLEDARLIRAHLMESHTISTARRILMQFKACCDWAVDEQLIDGNPFSKLPMIRSRRSSPPIHPFSESEKNQIITAFEGDPKWSYYAPFVKFLFLTGARTSEAVGLQWQYVEPDLSAITFASVVVERKRKGTKTGKTRVFPVNAQLKDVLLSVRPSKPMAHDPVFPSKQGLTIDAHNFLTRAWKDVMGSLPITYRPQYNTRHTFITLCLRNNVPVTQVAAWVGNSPKTIWQHYAGLVASGEVPHL